MTRPAGGRNRRETVAGEQPPEIATPAAVETADGAPAVATQPTPVLRLWKHGVWLPNQRLQAQVLFAYGDTLFDAWPDERVDARRPRATRVRRLPEVEARCLDFLARFRCVVPDSFGRGHMAITSHLVLTLPELAAQGWRIESDGQPVRAAQGVRCQITSGIDWFDLRAAVVFGHVAVDIAAALVRLRAGEQFIQLADGSFAMLPVEMLERFAPLIEIGATNADGSLRFTRSQGALLDALLATCAVTFDADAAFRKVQDALSRHATLAAADAPDGFRGELRTYQRQGLGWLLYLRDAGFGGCLADDMGLGKTIQVLGLLERIRTSGAPPSPSLAVVPRSLLVNWQREAERFTPQLRTHIHHGADRELNADRLRDIDLVITTYATLRNDAPFLAEFVFDTCILDEAQTVKNPDTQAAKAVRLIRARHRLVLTGTPIENHLGDLWSIFEFLNPGMLGTGPRFRRLIDDPRATPDSTTLELIAKAVHPFLLRRSKAQVMPQLPPKTETTLYCELDGRQQEEYDTRLAAIRAELFGMVEAQGLGRSKMKVIEALLRLRQCACHAGLVDKGLAETPSAKLDLLLEQLQEVTEEGHKALVFSQFTSFLSFVKGTLDRAGIVYEYLDGKTHDRQERVDRFQNDPDCRVFLISLKAGGLGLNLTAAEYVYILDPWWNPAAEAQAVDRAHRIGQVQSVFAYRLIARNTVEEKVLELQQRKRDLAEAILTADKSLMKKLTVEDLRLLLS